MIIYSIFTLTLSLVYVFLILFILQYWNNESRPSLASSSIKNLKISIIIPVRNEEKKIEPCIRSILKNNFFRVLNPEIIIVNDHSSDNTVLVIESLQCPYIILLNLSDYLENKRINAFKKAAINYALTKATGDIVIQLDGDVTIGKNYLKTIHDFFVCHNPDFVTAPVIINPGKTLLSEFQSLDMAGMMALTKAGIDAKKWYMANGANMAYKRDLLHFNEDGPASGDDIYGIQQILEQPDPTIKYLKDTSAFVFTSAEANLASFFKQRIRWATKNKTLKGGSMRFLMIIPYLNALLILLHIILSVLIGPVFLILFALHFFIKVSIDFIYLSDISPFFGLEKTRHSIVFLNIIHILYLSVIGTMSLFIKKYDWKARKVN